MKVLRSWLSELVDLDGLDPDHIGDTLSDLGLAVEDQRDVGAALDGIVVAEVLALRSHPKADRIQLVDVAVGDGEPLQICCGAFNMAVGDRVPLATLGTTMADGMKIERRKMRGEWSNGMLCAPDEIGFGIDHSGIMILSPDATVGAPLAEELGVAGDVLWDLEVNPNRPDAMSIQGVARDLAARLGRDLRVSEPAPLTAEAPDLVAGVTVVNEAADGCGRFVARVVTDVTVGPSDPKLAARLALMGMRPINNVVDASNAVMLELGQPSHPYDLDKVGGGGFRVRWARAGETLVTLDDVERTLEPTDLLICDADDVAIGIAGVMGGASSEIDDSTTRVVVEMAWFQPLAIAKTSRRLGLRSEASARFEKGCDWAVIERAMARFAELLAPSGAKLVDGSVSDDGDLPPRDRVLVRTDRLNAVLGTDLPPERIRAHLDALGFAPESAGPDTTVEPPTWRLDSATEIDAIEEVARLEGYTTIETRVPPSVHVGELSDRQRWRRELRRTMAGLGCSEAMPLPFLAPGDLTRAGLADDGISILNPLVADESVLRTSLLPGLAKSVQHNLRHRNRDVALFEIGRVVRRPADSGAALPDEAEHLAAVIVGAEAPAAVEMWRAVADAHRRTHRLVSSPIPGLHPTRSAQITAGDRPIGSVGQIDPDVAAAFEIDVPVAWLEIDLDAWWEVGFDDVAYRPISRYPSSDVDLAFEVPDEVPAGDVAATIEEAGEPLVVAVDLFDVYRGDQVADGARSLAFSVRMQADDRTLSDADIADVRQRCIDAVVAEHRAALRG